MIWSFLRRGCHLNIKCYPVFLIVTLLLQTLILKYERWPTKSNPEHIITKHRYCEKDTLHNRGVIQHPAIVFLSQQIQIRIQLVTFVTTPDRYRDTVLMENSTSWCAVVITGSDFMALFLFCCFTPASLISLPPCYPSSSPPAHQNKSFIAPATQQCFHYHLPPLPLSPG